MSSTEPSEIERPSGAGIPGLPPDWPEQTTTKIVDLIDTVRVKTSGPAIGVARTVVYGLIILLLVPVALVLLVAASVRGLDVLFPGSVGSIYLVLGALFAVAGLFCWSRRPRGAAG
jgi:hypothetical protein